jgi:hypothetical protein
MPPDSDPRACTGISSTIGMIVLSRRDWPGRRHLWSLVIIPVLGALYIVQLLNGINLLLRPSDPSPVHVQALLGVEYGRW